ncbi:putative class V chitinase [Dactylonectria macrodidyma]|uniref:chitinase n=1 Tax=Dactylonectria macrodidyma TaxID=307937 RepID=A0A9P9ILF1_9HYPO|nr:putative class V chitinase [Dactylonectria macrodidyma]
MLDAAANSDSVVSDPTKDICINNCDRKSDCDPGGFGTSFAKKKSCPLNVCCSKHGFCGTTKDFCGNKKVRRPSCTSTTSSFARVVGYYEGWSPSRPCKKFYPENIPAGIYTHLNFAFASIDPNTYQVVPSSDSDVDLMKRLVYVKKRDPALKVFIAIGGWTFNDPGPTATTFSDIARDTNAQRKFISSLISFMSTYGFDGVDLDWEYPQAEDRSGRDEDYANFPKFAANLKKALQSSGGRSGLSITLPASYWYLQHFDIKKLQPHVDFFNMMTYDFHGVWDKPNKWVGPYLNSHTNLTEIKDAMDLLWRNDISSDKVVLGLAFYGRGFTAANPNCMNPGCNFASGSSAMECSNEVSVLLISEIVDLVKAQGLKATVDKTAAVNIIKYGKNQWATFDNEATFKMKADFARSQCMGGVMVWAVSHGTKEGLYSQRLSKVAGRKAKGHFANTIPGSGTVATSLKDTKQCRWTACNESKFDWVRMLRKDSGARKNEFMVDGTGCSKYGVHKLCCPPDTTPPTCGWYTHNNGKCNNACPSGYREIGGNSQYCNRVTGWMTYQAACCSVQTDNMELYGQCDWTGWPSCGLETCNKETVASSSIGSGASACLGGERKYCCDQDEKKWTGCGWYSDLDFGETQHSSSMCFSNCPSDMVRVAMSNKDCKSGAKARCCDPSITEESKSTQDSYLDEVIEAFLDDPFCSDETLNDTFPSKRWLPNTTKGMAVLDTRQMDLKLEQEMAMISLIETLFFAVGAVALSDVLRWNALVVPRFSRLSYANLYDYMHATTEGELINDNYGDLRGPSFVVCNLAYLNSVAGDDGGDDSGSGLTTCVCLRKDCCHPNDKDCINFDPDAPWVSKRDVSTLDLHHGDQLEERGERKTYPVSAFDANGNQVVFDFPGQPYAGPADTSATSERDRFKNSYTFDPNCFNVHPIIVDSLNTNTNLPVGGFENDHALERQALPMWAVCGLDGTVNRDGDTYKRNGVQYRIPLSFFAVTMATPMQGIGPARGGAILYTPFERVMNALGSSKNRDVMTFCIKSMNNIKSRLWSLTDGLINRDALSELIYTDNNPDEALVQVRNVIVAMNFHNTPNVRDRLRIVVNEIREELHRAEGRHLAAYNERVYAVDHFDAWLKEHLRLMKSLTKDFVEEFVKDFRLVSAEGSPLYSKAEYLLQVCEVDIITTGWFPQLP